ncbi:MAG: OsmC family peroxiredoxin [Ardenticatenaceae bacterium]
MAAIRQASVTWNGDLMSGKGVATADTSKAFSQLPVSWASRAEDSGGNTSPEELIAAAHASCFSMALSGGLARAGTPPEELQVTATVTFDRVDGGYKVVSSALNVRGRVPGIDSGGFQQAAEAAKDGCPVSQALKGNVELSVEATLAG